MGIDGLFLYKLKGEIGSRCLGTRIEKIHQPSKEELVILLRRGKESGRLFISIRPSSPRINFEENGYENPAEPPMFCMLMRKYLSGAKFVCIEDNGFERIAVLQFDSVNEMGDSVRFRLVTELIGKQTNVILVGGDGRIVDSLRRSDLENGGRIIQPGAKYVFPDRKEKRNILNSDIDTLTEEICRNTSKITDALMNTIDGISPLISREIAVRAGIDTDKVANQLDCNEKRILSDTLNKFVSDIRLPAPTAITDDSGIPFEFSYTDITQYGKSASKVRFGSLSELLTAVYSERDRKERIRSFANDLVRLLGNVRTRTLKKIAVREKELGRCEDAEKLRICGELLKANLYAVERGVPFVDVQNYYDPGLATVRIPLNPALSPAQNAQKYFKEYKKSCNAGAVLGELIADSKAELQYIDSVIDELSRASSVSDLTEIRSELAESGYIKSDGGRKKQQLRSKPFETVAPDGSRILIGRNNRQNDELTLHMADKNDMWFHTKNIPGSHVIVRCGGEPISDETVMFAAKLAAGHSSAANSSSVPVDYTPVKYIKKPAGAKPGMVIYKKNRTVYVTPGEDTK